MRIIITILVLSALSFTSLKAQYYDKTEYFKHLSLSLSSLTDRDDIITKYCELYDKRPSPLNEFDALINIGDEQYRMSERSFEFYESFENLNHKDKCRLLFSYASYESEVKDYFNSSSIPLDLIYLPIAISGLNIYYNDIRTGFGIWGLHFMPAIKYGLTIDTCYDQRLDILSSTSSSIAYLKDLHNHFGSWKAAISAFSSGVPAYKKMHLRADTEQMDIAYETYFYFDIFLAVVKWMNDNKIVYPGDLFSKPADYKEVTTNVRMHFDQIAQVLQISKDSLVLSNPLFICEVIDGRFTPKKFNLPQGADKMFYSLQDSISKFNDSLYFPPYIPSKKTTSDVYYSDNSFISTSPGEDFEEIKYKIVSGDNLGSIAVKYGVKVSELQAWNNIGGTNIYAGQQISIWVKKGTKQNFEQKPAEQKTEPKPTTKNESQNAKTATKSFEAKDYKFVETYEVKPGDSPYKIAQKYSWASAEDIMEWNNIADPSKMQVGQKLKIYKKK